MLIEQLVAIVGLDHVLTGERVSSRSTSWANHQPCKARAIVRPGNGTDYSAGGTNQ